MISPRRYFDILTYIQIATIDIGKAERIVNIRHPYVGTINIAKRYSKILPNDQNSSITTIMVARIDDGKYSSINVELKYFIKNISCSLFNCCLPLSSTR